MPAPEQPKAEDLKQSLEQLGTQTTAADLVRAKGQSRKVRVIQEQQLMDWILKLLQTHLAGKANAFSDEEKQALIKDAQEEIGRRIKREQEVAAERDKAKLAMSELMERMSAEHASQEDLRAMLEDLKRQLAEREQFIQDLEDDKEDIEDKFRVNSALLKSTIEEKEAEKEKLKVTVRNQMLRSNALVEGVIDLDATYYGGRHQNASSVADDAGVEDQFYHDFDVSAEVVDTLRKDLEKLQQITQAASGETLASSAQTVSAPAADDGLMQRNLVLLEQLKAGSLRAMDVAAPVESLVEAMVGVRSEAESLRQVMSQAVGPALARASAIAAVPDSDGEPAQVLSGVTEIARALAGQLGEYNRSVKYLKQMADNADAARQTAEQELEAATIASNHLLETISTRTEATEAPAQAQPVVDVAAQSLEERYAAAAAVVARLRGHDQAVSQQLKEEHVALVKQLAEADERQRQFKRETDELRAQRDAAVSQANTLTVAQRTIAEAIAVNAPVTNDTHALVADAAQVAETVHALVTEKATLLARVHKLEHSEYETRGRLAKAEEELTEAKAERDEMALSGKEIISTLTQSRDARAHELEAIKKKHQDVSAQLSTLEARVAASESANRTLSESLIQIATAEQDGGNGVVATGRVDLEMALAQLPEEGETDVVMPADIGAQFAAGGRKLAAALLERKKHNEAAQSQLSQELVSLKKQLELARRENEEARAAAERQQSDIRSAEAEVQAVRAELEAQGRDLSLKTQELAGFRSESAKANAELIILRKRSDEHEDRFRQSTSAFQQGSKEKEQLKQKIQALERAEQEFGNQLANAEERARKSQEKMENAQSELNLLRAEYETQGRDLSAKVQALAAGRGDVASLKAELTVSHTRMEDQERRLTQASSQLAEARNALVDIRTSYDESKERTEALEESLKSLIAALRSITSAPIDGGSGQRRAVIAEGSVGLDKAEQRLDMMVAQAPDQIAAASQSYATAVRERFESLVKNIDKHRTELTEAQASMARQSGELASIRAQIVDRDGEIAAHKASIERGRQEQTTLLERIAVLKNSFDEKVTELAQAQYELDSAHADVDDKRARGETSQGLISTDNQRLRSDLETIRNRAESLETQVEELTEKVESSEARLKAQRDELAKRLAERDGVIQQKDKMIDQYAAQRADVKGLEAQVASLRQELVAASDRLKVYETSAGEQLGDGVKRDDLGRELSSLRTERDQLRDQMRKIEADLVEEHSVRAQIEAQLVERRKDIDSARGRLAKEVSEIRERSNLLIEENRHLKEEVAGLNARVRRLSEGGKRAISDRLPIYPPRPKDS